MRIVKLTLTISALALVPVVNTYYYNYGGDYRGYNGFNDFLPNGYPDERSGYRAFEQHGFPYRSVQFSRSGLSGFGQRHYGLSGYGQNGHTLSGIGNSGSYYSGVGRQGHRLSGLSSGLYENDYRTGLRW